MTAVARTQRWTPLCQDCYQRAEPDQYVPDLTSYGECAVCGESGLIVNAHPEVARKATAGCGATLPMNWTTDEAYQCDRHRAGRHVAIPGKTAAGVIHMGAEWPITEETR